MASFLFEEAESLKTMGEKTCTYAAAFEKHIFSSSKNYVESTYRYKREKSLQERNKNLANNPLGLFVDAVLPLALAGYDKSQGTPDGEGLTFRYLRDRGIVTGNTPQDALQFIDYLDYDDLINYLKFFTKESIDNAVSYGDNLARNSQLKPGRRMDGTPLPKYPPTKLPIVKVTLHQDSSEKKEANSKDSKKES